ncbi:MAG: hypothetical protein ABIR34_01640 [Marmoricola sp.]
MKLWLLVGVVVEDAVWVALATLLGLVLAGIWPRRRPGEARREAENTRSSQIGPAEVVLRVHSAPEHTLWP